MEVVAIGVVRHGHFSCVGRREVREHEGAVDKLWAETVHCFNAMFYGIHPERDAMGEPFANQDGEDARLTGAPLCRGIRFVAWIKTGDLDWLCNHLGYPHFNSNHPCWFDDVSRDQDTEYPMTDLSRGANWKTTLLDDEAGCCPCTDHVIGTIVGFTRYHTPGDLMHTGCLGVLSWFLGGVCWELVYDGPFAGGEDERCKALFDLIRGQYAMLGTESRLTTLKTTMFKGDGFSGLKAKAAVTQHLLFALHGVCQQVSEGTDRDLHRLAAFHYLTSMYTIFKNGDMFLERAEAERALECVDAFYEHYAWLLQYNLEKARLNYPIVPKLHMLWHIAYLSRFLNPVKTWAYEWEDFMNTLVTAAKACLAGSQMKLVGNKVMHHFFLVLDLRVRAAAGVV